MAMNPRTHPRGTKPDFTLPRPNPNPSRMTDALWWLVCMREALEPSSENGGTFANKPGSHNAGENLRNFGQGNGKTDHSIRDSFNRTGPWWKTKCSAHDWTFPDAQRGDYKTINKYTNRVISSMRDPNDPRPDDVYFYILGQADGDRVVEGYNERDDESQTGDSSHTWHRHDSFRRNIIGSFAHMWKALTIDMGWSVAEWQRSIAPASTPKPTAPVKVKMLKISGELPELRRGMKDPIPGLKASYVRRAQAQLSWLVAGDMTIDGDYGDATAAAIKLLMKDNASRSSSDGSIIGAPEWRILYALA